MITEQGEILRHIKEEFIITFGEMIKIYKRHTNNQLVLLNDK